MCREVWRGSSCRWMSRLLEHPPPSGRTRRGWTPSRTGPPTQKQFLLDHYSHKVRTYKEYHSVCPSSKLGLSQPLSRQWVFPSPQKQGGGGTLACGWGVGGSPNSDEGHTLWYSLYVRTYSDLRLSRLSRIYLAKTPPPPHPLHMTHKQVAKGIISRWTSLTEVDIIMARPNEEFKTASCSDLDVSRERHLFLSYVIFIHESVKQEELKRKG